MEGIHFDGSKYMWKVLKRNSNYEISNCGDIRKRTTKRVCSGSFDSLGYRRFRLYRNGKYINLYSHVLVAETYLVNPKGKKEVNHKDRNPSNNHVDNLEWVSKAENMNHVYGINKRYGISSRRGGYVVSIKIKGKKKHLGDYKNMEDAYCVFYNEFNKIHGFYPWKSELN